MLSSRERRQLAWLGVPALALYLLFVVGPVLADAALLACFGSPE